MTMIFM